MYAYKMHSARLRTKVLLEYDTIKKLFTSLTRTSEDYYAEHKLFRRSEGTF
jgi:hypothetical protein